MASSAPFAGDSTLGHFHGDGCPAGHYCPKGSAKPIPCPPGKKLIYSDRALKEEVEIMSVGLCHEGVAALTFINLLSLP